MDAAHVLIERLNGPVAVHVRNGKDQHVTICPVDGAVNLFLTVQALGIILRKTDRGKKKKKKTEYKKLMKKKVYILYL